MPPLEDELSTELGNLETAGLKRKLRAVEQLGNHRVRFDAVDALDFASNDYLGLAADRRLSEAAAACLGNKGFGGTAARLIAGNDPLHHELESAIARYKRADAALLFSSGYAANVGCIPALAGKGDVILADELNHASLVDGCRLSRADVKVFAHLDLTCLRVLLENLRRARRRLIVVDSVFSMDGDMFPLDELVALAKRYDAVTYVDDAHGTGVLGATGRGSAELFEVEGAMDVVMGTLGKALGASGAFVCGSSTLVEFLLNRARSFIFTTATPASVSAAALESLRIVTEDSAPREKLWSNCDHFAKRVKHGPLPSCATSMVRNL